MHKLHVTYELKEGKEIKHLPVHIVDVDDLFIWLMIERDANTQWNVGVQWSRIVGELLHEPVKELKEEYAKMLEEKREIVLEPDESHPIKESDA